MVSIYLIPFSYQTTTSIFFLVSLIQYILFHFLIKPQPVLSIVVFQINISYSIFLSNHNLHIYIVLCRYNISYSIFLSIIEQSEIIVNTFKINICEQTTTTSLTLPAFQTLAGLSYNL